MGALQSLVHRCLPGLLAAMAIAAAPAVAWEPPSGEVDSLALLQAASQALAKAIERNEKSLVSIARVKKSAAVAVPMPRDRWGLFRKQRPPTPSDASFVPDEFATGVVVSAQGAILTAYHVLKEDCQYWVRTVEGKVYQARVHAADPRSDMAVLQVDAKDLKPITLGDATKLRKGNIVIALGNPYAIARDGQVSASWGIVSNLSRKAPSLPSADQRLKKTNLHQFGTLIQTDARLNLGASGGALLNLRGEMVGLTVSLSAASGYEQSAGYAIPVDTAFLRIVAALKQGREVEYGFLGVAPENLNRRGQAGKGVWVSRVEPGTPAQQYGLMVGDVITAVNGRPINDVDGLMLQVGRLDAGVTVAPARSAPNWPNIPCRERRSSRRARRGEGCGWIISPSGRGDP